MSAKTPFGPPVADDENVYRAILSLPQWAPAYDGPSSAAFDDDVFSVEIASRTTPEGTASRKRSVLRIVEFNCGFARTLGFDTRDERDEIAPHNMAHAHVYPPSEGRKGKGRQLARACKVVEFDAEEAERLRAQIARQAEAESGGPPADQLAP